MAVQGSGTHGNVVGAEDRVAGPSGRDGSGKRTQTEFPIKWGMRDRTNFEGAGPASPGSGPDASSPNPLDPEPRSKLLTKQPDKLVAKWDQKNGDGQGLDASLSGRVLGEAILSGSTSLPGSTSQKTPSGANPSDPGA